MSRRAALAKLADKTCNPRDVANNPPADWPWQRRREYFDWASAVVDALPVFNKRMLKAFRGAFEARP
jgi:guanosine-3',5'-bis(diphosphate) 3'-pyrophosphohydrolase